jgi:hypothetical protein
MKSSLYVLDVGLQAACFTKFGSILGLTSINAGVVHYPTEIAQREVAEKRGLAQLEFINIWRTSTAPNLNRQRTPAARRGLNLGIVDSSGHVVNVKAQPVELEYEVTFWSLDKEKINLITEEYIFWQQTLPNLNLLLDDTIPLKYYLKFGPLTDRSSIATKYELGQYHVFGCPVTVEGWVYDLTATSYGIIEKIILTCYDKDEVVNYEEIIVADSNQDVEKAATLKLFERVIT